MPDIKIICTDCKEEFVFGEGEQTYFKDRGLTTPKRCDKCRLKRRSGIGRNLIEIKPEEKKEE